jgi:hypothetical protein
MRIRNIILSLSLSAMAAGAGCSLDADDPTATEQAEEQKRRQKIGKADLWGSCLTKGPEKNFCGEKAPVGNCYCDKACVEMGDCCSDYGDACAAGETETCEAVGGSCMSDPGDVTFPALCEDLGMETADALCPAFNHACCVSASECQPVLCKLACQWGFETNDDGCEICSCADGPQWCGGFAGIACPSGQMCEAHPDPNCNDCPGTCVDIPEPAASCKNKCGGADPGKVCYCDAACEQYQDCCDDFEDECSDDREVAHGQCIKNSGDACTTDADCTAGGCGGELCFNPASGGGISTCECGSPSPSAVDGCGCVNGSCNWYK